MGKVGSKIARYTTRKFNAENRAMNVLAKAEATKPTPAPKHSTTVGILRKIHEDHPEWMEAQKNKHEGLDDRLKGMVVNPGKFGELKSKRTLPEDRSVVEDPEFGYLEPSHIRPGHFSIKQSLDFISRHQATPKTYTASHVAAEFKLDSAEVEDVLKHFQTFEVQIPKELLDKIEDGRGMIASDNVLQKPKVGTLGSGELKDS